MTAPLVPCAACARHLRADASACPFCRVPREPQALAYVPIPRMSRAALAALGATLTVVPITALVAFPDHADAQSHGHIRPMYGMPPRPHPTPRPDAGVAPPDAGVAHPDAGGASPDASVARPRPRARRPPPMEQMPVPLYGVSPKEGE